jgi:hypothetical protein
MAFHGTLLIQCPLLELVHYTNGDWVYHRGVWQPLPPQLLHWMGLAV